MICIVPPKPILLVFALPTDRTILDQPSPERLPDVRYVLLAQKQHLHLEILGCQWCSKCPGFLLLCYDMLACSNLALEAVKPVLPLCYRKRQYTVYLACQPYQSGHSAMHDNPCRAALFHISLTSIVCPLYLTGHVLGMIACFFMQIRLRTQQYA